nr:hypothetical protein [Tanacetum cinerariifolium]
MYGYDGLPMMPVAPPSPNYIPGLEEPQTPPATQDENEHELVFIQPHDPNFVPEPIYPEYIPLEDEHILPVEEQPLPPVVSPTTESPRYVAESDPEEDPKEYEDDETEDGPVDHPMDGGDDEDDDDGDSSGYDAEVERLLAMPTPSPSPLTSLPPPSIRERLPPRKRLCLSSLGSRYEVGESSTRGRWVDYGFVDTVEAEIRHQGIGEVWYGNRDTWIDLAKAEEAYAAQEAWAHSVGLSQTVHHELQTLLTDSRDSLSNDRHETTDGRHAGRVVSTTQIMAPVTRQGQNPPPLNTDTLPHHMTSESVQAMIDQALLRNSTNGDGSQSSHRDNPRNVLTTRPCFYADFMKCQSLNFKGNEGVVSLTRWIEKMESVFNINGCAIENQVKFATCTLLDAALTWWNGQIRALGPEAYAMTWEVLKKKLTNKYCPQGKLKKLDIELWNLKVKGNDVPTYTNRFQELTLICTKFIANENKKIDKSSGNTNVANAQRDGKETPKGNGCFECGASGHFKRDCLKLRNKNGGNKNDQGWVRYASILFDTSADRIFISTAFSSLVNIDPTPLGSSYDVELADGKI